jgi:RecB family exonuclease
MTTAEKAMELLEELKELRKIDKLLKDRYNKKNVNVRFHQHYGECKDYERVEVNSRHLPRFIEVLQHVIQDVEIELNKI